MRRSKRGTEKPIEIFVALFIILAVAMLLLKMMRDQTAGSEKQLKDAQRQQAMQDYKQSSQQSCNDLCNQARDTGCQSKAIARFCLAKYHAPYLTAVEQYGWDIDQNYEFNDNWVEDVGMAYCEGNVFCSQMTQPPCGCKGGLTVEKCAIVLCDYYESIGFTHPDAVLQMEKNFIFGDCTLPDPLSDKVKTWVSYLNAYSDPVSGGTVNLLKCPFTAP